MDHEPTVRDFGDVTLADAGVAKLRALCSALGYDAFSIHRASCLFRKLAVGWGGRPAQAKPWPSDVTDDHSPFELSIAIDGDLPEIRFLVEAQGEAPSLRSNWEAGLRVNERLAAEHGVPMDRFAAVADLFAVGPRSETFGIWHAVCLQPGREPRFKVYLNPRAKGADQSAFVLETAMTRLRMETALRNIPPLGPHNRFFSLDLAANPRARVKIYAAHPNATPEEVEAAVAMVPGPGPGRAAAFCRAMAGSNGPFDDRPVFTCLSFCENASAPTSATVYFPVRAYAEHDGVVRDRILRFVESPKAAVMYRSALNAAASHRELDTGVGLQTYVSIRLEPDCDRFTVYFSPELHGSASSVRRITAGASSSVGR